MKPPTVHGSEQQYTNIQYTKLHKYMITQTLKHTAAQICKYKNTQNTMPTSNEATNSAGQCEMPCGEAKELECK